MRTKPTPVVTALLPLLLIVFWSSGCSKSKERSSQESVDEVTSTLIETKTVNRPGKVSLANAVGKLAPEIELEVAFGGPSVEKITLAQLQGKVVVLDYWATW